MLSQIALPEDGYLNSWRQVHEISMLKLSLNWGNHTQGWNCHNKQIIVKEPLRQLVQALRKMGWFHKSKAEPKWAPAPLPCSCIMWNMVENNPVIESSQLFLRKTSISAGRCWQAWPSITRCHEVWKQMASRLIWFQAPLIYLVSLQLLLYQSHPSLNHNVHWF